MGSLKAQKTKNLNLKPVGRFEKTPQNHLIDQYMSNVLICNIIFF